MPEKVYQITRDSYNRWCAQIANGITVGLKMHGEADERRIHRNEHAYVVLDLQTPLGVLRIRDIRVMWSVPKRCHYIRWKQWSTGRVRNGRAEYLDIAGPLDRDTRDAFTREILGVFEQIKKEAALGTLGRSNPQLAELKALLERVEKDDAPVEHIDGPAEA